jgi:paraquat-inducible protein A
MNSVSLIACHECDLLQRTIPIEGGATARCQRCDSRLYRGLPGTYQRALALTLSAAVLFVIANTFPVVELSVKGITVETTLFGAVTSLYSAGMWPIAALVLLTAILLPAVNMSAAIYLLVPLNAGTRVMLPEIPLRVLRHLTPWAMIEVVMLALLIALVKLQYFATVVPGIALWALGAVMLLQAAAGSAWHPDDIWRHVRGDEDCIESVCRHGQSTLHRRKPQSLSRTWALLLAAIVLYIPALTLPVMTASTLFQVQSDTILSGVVALWISGSWLLAVIVFIASIAVPMLKILSLGFLAWSAQIRSVAIPRKRTQIYRLLEMIGRWSMLDLYVITLLVSLVHFEKIANISAGPGAIAFGAVVVLTMLATSAFDPRLIWDALESEHG